MSVISNNPRSHSKVTEPWIFIDDCFTEEELQKIEQYCSSKSLNKASTVGSDSNARVSNNCFNDVDQENAWFINRINQAIEHANKVFYNFDLYGYSFF